MSKLKIVPRKVSKSQQLWQFAFYTDFWFEWLVEDNDGHVLAAIRHGLGLRWNWLSDYWFRMNACHLHQRFVHKDSERIGLSRVLLSFSIAAPQLRTLKYLCRMRYDEIKTHKIRLLCYDEIHIQILTIDFVQIYYGGCICDPKIEGNPLIRNWPEISQLPGKETSKMHFAFCASLRSQKEQLENNFTWFELN